MESRNNSFEKDSLMEETVTTDFHSIQKAMRTSNVHSNRIRFRHTQTAHFGQGLAKPAGAISPQSKFFDNFSQLDF